MGMHEETADVNEETGSLSRRGLFVSGGLLTAGLGALGAQGIATASAAGPVKIEGIDKATADRLAVELTRRAAAEAGDAT